MGMVGDMTSELTCSLREDLVTRVAWSDGRDCGLQNLPDDG